MNAIEEKLRHFAEAQLGRKFRCKRENENVVYGAVLFAYESDLIGFETMRDILDEFDIIKRGNV